ncbi:MAG: sigma-70 family RNA polymerase sigma factor [Eubacteriales bacterium]|nr:sigma-70 family RNA polymerase sigma factor [Eubacteriales bacterium]
MSKKYYWILDGKYYEVSKETYQKYKKEHDHSKMLQNYENEVHIFSLDAMAAEDVSFHEVIADPNEDTEEIVLKKMMVEKLRAARETLSSEEQLLLTLMYDEGKTMGEVGKAFGISQQAISKKHGKVIEKLKKFLKI